MKLKNYIQVFLIITICLLTSLLNAQECYTLSVEECADYWYCQLDNDICTGYEPLIESSNLDQRADNRWSLTINSTNTEVEANEGNNIFHLGMCSECSDGYNVWEESESMNPFTSTYIDLYFLHLDYQPIVGYSDFNTDYRSILSSDQLVVWNIAAFINGVDEIQLEWSFDNFIPQEYKIYLVDGSVRYNMRNSTSVLLQKEAFYPNGNETNIKLEIGICADTGTTTHYLDSDGDGWGSDISGEFCDGYAPANWVTNQDDVDNDCNCEENNLESASTSLIDGACYDCSGLCIANGNEQVDDACGVCGGDGVQQACGCGNPGAFGIPDGECDCIGNVEDCAGVCGGSSILVTLCEDTDGDGLGSPGSETEECVDENGDINIMEGCELPDLNLFLSADGSVFYNSSEAIAGFQFNVDGTTVSGASGGDAEAAGFTFMVNTSSSTVLGFSFLGATFGPGCGTITVLSLDGEATGLSGIVMSDSNGQAIPFEYYVGDDTELVADCSDEYPDCAANEFDCAGECGSTAEVDECGECNGPGPMPGYTCDGTPELFVYNSSMQQAFYFFTTVMIDSIAINLNDWVGVFNGDICVGANQWNTSECGGGVCQVVVGGYDGTEFTDGYMLPGDIPNFKIFDASENTYYNATPSANIPWDDMNFPVIESLSAIATIDYCLSLHSGANLKSFHALPEDNSIASVMSPLGASITGVITEGESVVQVNGNWYGSAQTIEPEKGYWILLTANTDNASLCLEYAKPTDISLTYNLHTGANLISFPADGSVGVGDALPDDIEASVSAIITEGESSVHIGDNWYGSMQTFNGGKGYWLIASDPILFSFNLEGLVRIQELPLERVPIGYDYNQSTEQAFYFVENVIIDGEAISSEDWILAYNGKTLVGARQWTGEMVDIPVMGNDGNAYSDGYIKSGKIPRFMHFNEYNGEMTTLYSNNTPKWENNAIFMLGALEERNVLPEKILLNAYPNPFNPSTTLSISVPVDCLIQVSIYNIAGQEIEELVNEFNTAGTYKYTWNAALYPSGVYFARFSLNNSFHTQKLVLMK